jgi:hypothetical protein
MLQTLIERSEEYDQLKADYSEKARYFHFDEQARIVPPGVAGFSSLPLTVSDHALTQICAKLGPAVFGKGSQKSLPRDYLQAIAPDLRAENLNRHIANTNGNSWMVRAYKETARAVLAGDYPGGRDINGDFDNTQYLKIVQSFLDEIDHSKFPGLKIARSSVTEDDLNIRIIWKNDPRGGAGRGYGLGTAIINGETGLRKLKIPSLIQRHSCENSIVVDADGESFAFIHRGSFAALRTQFKAAIGKALQIGANALDKMLAAEEEQIPDFYNVLEGLAEKHNWPREIAMTVAEGTEGQHTRAGIVNGVTWAAHTIFDDPNDQMEMETLGGQLLYAPANLFTQLANDHRRAEAGLR